MFRSAPGSACAKRTEKARPLKRAATNSAVRFELGSTATPGCAAESTISKVKTAQARVPVLLLARFGLGIGISWAVSASSGDEAVLRGLFAVEDSAARAAHGYARLDFFRADGAVRQRL